MFNPTQPSHEALGAYHPLISYNVKRLLEISGLDEVSFHMSGTEAVMQAVRLARYHTGRTHVVRFCGAYHGCWGDVKPGVGNPSPAPQTYTLSDMAEASLRVLCTRQDIACVLVNPLQALHPNAGAPSDSTLIDSSRHAHFDRAHYTEWLRRLRAVCSERGIVLIFDEVFVGFRLDPGGAQAYFGIRADLVTYGKSVAGGLPIGVLCSRAAVMRRFREERPADICFARGTFNAHPYVMGAMFEFLQALQTDAVNVAAFLAMHWHGSKIVIGDGPQRAELEKRHPEVTFAGYRFGENLAAHLAAVDVMVFPSQTDTFGLVNLEAMACEVPVAAFPVPGPIDVIQDGNRRPRLGFSRRGQARIGLGYQAMS